MIRFYPRDVGMFRTVEFDFTMRHLPVIPLEYRPITDYKDFHDRQELIEFLKAHGVRLDDPKYPLEFERHNFIDFGIAPCTHVVKQQCLIGWIKDDLL